MKSIKRCFWITSFIAACIATCLGGPTSAPAPSSLPPCIIEYSAVGAGQTLTRDVLYRADHTYVELSVVSTTMTNANNSGGTSSVPHSGSYSYAVDPNDPTHASISYQGGGLGPDQLYFNTPTTGNQNFSGSGATDPGSFFAMFPKYSDGGTVAFSTRCNLATDGTVTVGLVVAPSAPRWVLIRAVTSTLANFGVVSSLSNPSFQLYNSHGEVVASSSVWSADPNLVPGYDTAFSMVGEFPLNSGSDEGVLLIPLQPGAYTAIFKGTGSGQILCEAYLLPY